MEPGCPNPNESLFFALLPYVEEENYYNGIKAGILPNSSAHTVKLYISPADPTVNLTHADNCASYAANAVAFDRRSSLPASFPDGLSYTIALAEHYAFKRGGTQFSWYTTYSDALGDGIVEHRASFAEFHAGPASPLGTVPPDVYPVTTGNPPVTTGSVPGLTFEAAPPVSNYDPRLAQTPHRSGMLVATVDGSVHSLAPAVDPTVYWAMVTPDGREDFQLPY